MRFSVLLSIYHKENPNHFNEALTSIWDAQTLKPDEIAYYMNLSHIFISTSWWEGFGLPPLEAMACGCAVILSNSGGVNEYAQLDDNCLMFDPRNEKN